MITFLFYGFLTLCGIGFLQSISTKSGIGCLVVLCVICVVIGAAIILGNNENPLYIGNQALTERVVTMDGSVMLCNQSHLVCRMEDSR